MPASSTARTLRPEALPPPAIQPETSALALYQQVKDHIARKIQDGSWKAGDRLPSENDLVTQFGMSRMTVNRALRELANLVRKDGIKSVALPRLATGVGGLDWADVKPLIQQHMADLGVPVLVYEVYRKDQKADEKLA